MDIQTPSVKTTDTQKTTDVPATEPTDNRQSTGCSKKVAPQSFSLFSQQPFGILTQKFTALFIIASYIKMPSKM